MRQNPKMIPASTRNPRQPFVSALLRMAYQITREYQLEALRERGFGDLNQALLNVMVYPHPDGVRPGDLAERINMTRQATNYLLGELEALGYIQRRAQKGSTRRLVFLTRRGWQSIDRHRAAVLELEAQWAKAIGQKRFGDFKETLAELIALKVPDGPKVPNALSAYRQHPVDL
jgi:DNA-binding MarR family transcriptional regulator